MTIPFEEFEKAVIQKLLKRETSINKILHEQYKNAQVIDRRFTGAGFFTSFDVPEDIVRICQGVDYCYGNIIASVNGNEEYGFHLFITKGAMCCLEGYMWADSWPETIYSYELYGS